MFTRSATFKLFLINIVMFAIMLYCYFCQNVNLFSYFMFNKFKGANPDWQRYIYYMFSHKDLKHLFGNMLLLVYFTYECEKKIGQIYTTVIYFLSGIITICIAAYDNPTFYCVGASGAIAPFLTFYVCLNFKQKSQHIFPFLFVLLGLYSDIIGFFNTNTRVSHDMHLIGYGLGVIFFLLYSKLFKKEQSEIYI